jgi:hypothetical protein
MWPQNRTVFHFLAQLPKIAVPTAAPRILILQVQRVQRLAAYRTAPGDLAA